MVKKNKNCYYCGTGKCTCSKNMLVGQVLFHKVIKCFCADGVTDTIMYDNSTTLLDEIVFVLDEKYPDGKSRPISDSELSEKLLKEL